MAKHSLDWWMEPSTRLHMCTFLDAWGHSKELDNCNKIKDLHLGFLAQESRSCSRRVFHLEFCDLNATLARKCHHHQLERASCSEREWVALLLLCVQCGQGSPNLAHCLHSVRIHMYAGLVVKWPIFVFLNFNLCASSERDSQQMWIHTDCDHVNSHWLWPCEFCWNAVRQAKKCRWQHFTAIESVHVESARLHKIFMTIKQRRKQCAARLHNVDMTT